ncbi:hypothetical protein ACN47A_41185 [Myxococcus fulvus]|uniref:hypothetical protein n=1 Tax=Myxococcus fulvus TaxID=33 RepID=UPI003B9AC927
MNRFLVLGLMVSSTALAGPVDLYRLYSGGQSDHFYTTSMDEAFHAASRLGYVYEGVAGKCLSTQEPGTVPLYRLYHASVGDHLYTTSWQERDIAIVTHGYANEGVACYVFAGQAAGTCPLYRLWGSSDHFYTLSWAEALSSRYAYEGVTGYLYAPGFGGCPG